MWAEKMRDDWSHTSSILSFILNTNTIKKSDQRTPQQLNPFEKGGRKSNGIPLNSREGFEALRAVADRWHKP